MLAVAPTPPVNTLSETHPSFFKRRSTMASTPTTAMTAPLPTAADIAEQLFASLKGSSVDEALSAPSVKATTPPPPPPPASTTPPRTETRSRRALTSVVPRLETVYDEQVTAPEPPATTGSVVDKVVLLRVLVKNNSQAVPTWVVADCLLPVFPRSSPPGPSFEVCSTHPDILKSLFTETSPFRIVPVLSTPAERSRDLTKCLNTRFLPTVDDRFLLTLSPAKLKELEDADPYGLGKRRVLIKPYAVADVVRCAGYKLLGSHVEGYGQAGNIMDVHTFIKVPGGRKSKKKQVVAK